MGTALRFTVVNRFPSFAAAHSHQILARELFCGYGLRKSFERCTGSQIRFQTTAWVHWAGGRDGPARSFSRLRLIESRSRMERQVLLEPPILRTGATWASGPRHTSSGALLQGQAPAVRMDYKQDTHLWRRKSDDRRSPLLRRRSSRRAAQKQNLDFIRTAVSPSWGCMQKKWQYWKKG